MVERVGHRFGDQALRDQALRHRSAGAPHNERLEFLGDALVNLIVAEALYARWPGADEGGLTRARAESARIGRSKVPVSRMISRAASTMRRRWSGSPAVGGCGPGSESSLTRPS